MRLSENGLPMGLLYAQGDILVERVGDVEISGHIIDCVTHASAIVAGGEKAGHYHRVMGSVTLFRDDALARDIPAGLYTLHLKVHSARAHLQHDEHAPITLTRGSYLVRRQRQLEPTDTGFYEQYGVLED
jgi:hypothetical protein